MFIAEVSKELLSPRCAMDGCLTEAQTSADQLRWTLTAQGWEISLST